MLLPWPHDPDPQPIPEPQPEPAQQPLCPQQPTPPLEPWQPGAGVVVTHMIALLGLASVRSLDANGKIAIVRAVCAMSEGGPMSDLRDAISSTSAVRLVSQCRGFAP